MALGSGLQVTMPDGLLGSQLAGGVGGLGLNVSPSTSFDLGSSFWQPSGGTGLTFDAANFGPSMPSSMNSSFSLDGLAGSSPTNYLSGGMPASATQEFNLSARTPPQNSLGEGNTTGDGVTSLAQQALNKVNDLMGSLFKKENQGALTLAGALLTAGGQRSNERYQAKENEKNRDWQKQMEDLKQQYAKELLELRQPKFEGGRTHGSFK